MEAKDIVYNHIEFFFSKTDLHSMMTIKALSYENWMQSIYDMYSVNPYLDDTKTNETQFHYNIMHTPAYGEIIKSLRKINKLSQVDKQPEYSDANKKKIQDEFDIIKQQYKNLYYYDEIYVYAHYVFNNIRKISNLGIQKGGGQISLEEFKQKIREKIKMLDL